MGVEYANLHSTPTINASSLIDLLYEELHIVHNLMNFNNKKEYPSSIDVNGFPKVVFQIGTAKSKFFATSSSY